MQIPLSNFSFAHEESLTNFAHFYSALLSSFNALAFSHRITPLATLLPSGAERGQPKNSIPNYGNYSATALSTASQCHGRQCCQEQVKPERVICTASAYFHWTRTRIFLLFDSVTILILPVRFWKIQKMFVHQVKHETLSNGSLCMCMHDL